jgi:hypothetical protein
VIARPRDNGENQAPRLTGAHIERVSCDDCSHHRGLLTRGDGPMAIVPGRGATDREIA